MIYTSGSTGRPKGVSVTHRAIVNRLAWMQDRWPLGPADRVLQKTPTGFDVSVWELFWPLCHGAAVVLAAPGAHRDPLELAEVIAAERVTTLHFVPSMLEAFLGVDEVTADAGVGGEPAPGVRQRRGAARRAGRAAGRALTGAAAAQPLRADRGRGRRHLARPGARHARGRHRADRPPGVEHRHARARRPPAAGARRRARRAVPHRRAAGPRLPRPARA